MVKRSGSFEFRKAISSSAIASGNPARSKNRDGRPTTIERILARDPVVVISKIDRYGTPWFEYAFSEQEIHSIAVVDDDSWEHAEE